MLVQKCLNVDGAGGGHNGYPFDNVVPKELALRLSATDRHTSQLIGLSAALQFAAQRSREAYYKFAPFHVMPPGKASRAMRGTYHFATPRPIRNVALSPELAFGSPSCVEFAGDGMDV